MFGYGKHLCPGRELAKLEMILFLKMFLRKFEYQLVEGQVFSSARKNSVTTSNAV